MSKHLDRVKAGAVAGATRAAAAAAQWRRRLGAVGGSALGTWWRRATSGGEGARPRRRQLIRRGVLALLPLIGIAIWATHNADRSLATVIPPAGVESIYQSHSPKLERRVTENRLARPVYPLSVIPGGAYSVAELRAYLNKDPVAKHSFDAMAQRMGDPALLSHLQVKQLTKPVRMFTQLRVGDKLYSSSNPVTVQAGESGFVHEPTGDLVARARCGNVMMMTVPAREARIAPPAETSVCEQPRPRVVVSEAVGARPVPAPLPVVMPPAALPVLPPMPLQAAALPPCLPPIMLPGAPCPPPAPVYLPPFPLSAPPIATATAHSNSLGLGLGLGLASASASATLLLRCPHRRHPGPQPVPEPTTMLLMGLGLGGAALARKIASRKQR